MFVFFFTHSMVSFVFILFCSFLEEYSSGEFTSDEGLAKITAKQGINNIFHIPWGTNNIDPTGQMVQ